MEIVFSSSGVIYLLPPPPFFGLRLTSNLENDKSEDTNTREETKQYCFTKEVCLNRKNI